MSFKFECGYCNRRLEAEDDWGGRSVECPDCNNSITIPHNLGTDDIPPPLPDSSEGPPPLMPSGPPPLTNPTPPPLHSLKASGPITSKPKKSKAFLISIICMFSLILIMGIGYIIHVKFYSVKRLTYGDRDKKKTYEFEYRKEDRSSIPEPIIGIKDNFYIHKSLNIDNYPSLKKLGGIGIYKIQLRVAPSGIYIEPGRFSMLDNPDPTLVNAVLVTRKKRYTSTGHAELLIAKYTEEEYRTRRSDGFYNTLPIYLEADKTEK